MMKRLLCAILFLVSVSLQSQTFEKAVFLHKTSHNTHILEAGDRLTVKYRDKGKLTLATSKLQNVEDGVLYLVDRPAIPLDQVLTIRYRDPGFLGIMDVENDAVYLDLKRGRNEIVLSVADYFGGWGPLSEYVKWSRGWSLGQ